MNELIVIDPCGLGKTEADQVSAVFTPMLARMKELETEYNQVISQEINPEVCKKAKELRIKFVKTRTGTDEIHKKAKAYYLAGGRFVDSWRTAQRFSAVNKEGELEKIEKHYELIEKEKKDKFESERVALLSRFVNDVSFYNLREMSEQGFDQLLNSSKIAFEAQKEAEKKAEDDRIKFEQEEKAEHDRIRAENAILKEKAIKRDLEEAKKLKKLESEKSKLRKELKEKSDAEDKIRDEKELQRVESERIEKETRYKDFLKDSGVNEETKHLFHIEKVGDKIKLYKVIGIFEINK